MVFWNRESGKPSSTTNPGIVVGCRLQRIKSKKEKFSASENLKVVKRKKKRVTTAELQNRSMALTGN